LSRACVEAVAKVFHDLVRINSQNEVFCVQINGDMPEAAWQSRANNYTT